MAGRSRCSNPWRAALAAALLVPALGPGAAGAAPTPCAGMGAVALPDARITLAEQLPAGDWKDPDGDPQAGLPALCRVAAVLSPSAGSAIRIEAWLPLEGWNGRLLGLGNGGYGGGLAYDDLRAAVVRGYAAVADDMGTAPATGMDGAPLVGQPVKWLDFGHRAPHAAAAAGRRLVAAFYGRPAHHAYFVGCSSGGQSALSEAQRHPEDYDGIIAGCAAGDRIGAVLNVVWLHRALRAAPDAVPTAASIALLRRAALASCGARDGLPGAEYLLDPGRCRLDPAALECRGEPGPECIPAPQVRALRALQAGPRNPRTGAAIYPGFPHGAESARFYANVAGMAKPPWDGLVRWVFGAGWDPATFDFDRDLLAVQGVLGEIVNATRADLSAFERRGGKLLLWNGWADPVIPAGSGVDYYERVIAAQPGDREGRLAAARRFARLFLAPGMSHCQGGPGPNAFGVGALAPVSDPEHDALAALVRWVEQGEPPERIVATKFVEDDRGKGIAFQRPLCPYPEVARPRAGGDPRQAAGWECGHVPE